MPCLAGRWPWSVYLGSYSGRQRSPLLATLRRMWGEAIPGSAYKQGIEPAFKQPVIILRESFRAISTCPVYVWNGPTKNFKFSCRKAKRQCGCSYGSCVSCPSSPSLLKVLCARLLKAQSHQLDAHDIEKMKNMASASLCVELLSEFGGS